MIKKEQQETAVALIRYDIQKALNRLRKSTNSRIKKRFIDDTELILEATLIKAEMLEKEMAVYHEIPDDVIRTSLHQMSDKVIKTSTDITLDAGKFIGRKVMCEDIVGELVDVKKKHIVIRKSNRSVVHLPRKKVLFIK